MAVARRFGESVGAANGWAYGTNETVGSRAMSLIRSAAPRTPIGASLLLTPHSWILAPSYCY